MTSYEILSDISNILWNIYLWRIEDDDFERTRLFSQIQNLASAYFAENDEKICELIMSDLMRDDFDDVDFMYQFEPMILRLLRYYVKHLEDD